MPRRMTPILQRLPEKISPALNRAGTVTIYFDGQPIEAFVGDTIGSAAYGAGIRLFSRSFKYHRPRGLLCCAGRCPNCLVTVDGTPNVRACTAPVAEGMRVEPQNVFPSLQRDLLAVIDKLDRLLPVGFYYKTFIYPRSAWPLYEAVLRNIAGLGKVDFSKGTNGQSVHRHLHPDVAVIGGGPAGLSAAIAAAEEGLRVVIVDDNPALGGHLLGETRVYDDAGEFSGRSGHEIATELASRLEGQANVEILAGAVAFGLYESNLIGVAQEVVDANRLIELRAGHTIIATGISEHPLVFENNDLPGVMLGSAATRLIRLWGVKPAQRAVVVSAHDEGLRVAGDLLEAGVRIAAVAEHRTEIPDGPELRRLVEAGVPILRGWSILEAAGRGHVESAVLVRLDQTGRSIGGTERREECSLVAVSTGLETNASLLWQAGCTVAYDEDLDLFTPPASPALGPPASPALGPPASPALGPPASPALGPPASPALGPPASPALGPRVTPPRISAAGDVTGVRDLRAALLGGRIAGEEAALSLRSLAKKPGADGGHDRRRRAALQDSRAELGALEQTFRARVRARPIAAIEGRASRKKFVCPCEDVTLKDIGRAVQEGFDHIETLKRYSTVTMGPCQGKMCAMNAVAACARATGRTISETGTTTSRPLIQPVSLGALAGPHLEPTRLTPLHHRHLELGAEMMDAGQWKRPRMYTSAGIAGARSRVEEEVRAVRERVGLIDVSTLGKIDLQGRDAVKLLERIYTNTWADLKVGRVRYAVMVDESGIILDDGTVARLGEDHFFISTTTSGIGSVEEWLAWWMEGHPEGTWLCAHVTNVTSALAAVNLAGPKSRDVLAKVTDLDVSPAALPYLRVVRGMVAGVPATILRIGFVGELGYEMHFAAEYGEYVWDVLMDAGQEFGIAPFGVEAQRTLRLEKGHIIVTQDTDALSTPLEAGMPWIVKFDKPDFIGKAALSHIRDEGLNQKLVGFQMPEASQVPEEGAQIVGDGGYPVGRVTSARFSPALSTVIGLAWVPVTQAGAGAEIRIQLDDHVEPARVVPVPFYDPDGSRMKS